MEWNWNSRNRFTYKRETVYDHWEHLNRRLYQSRWVQGIEVALGAWDVYNSIGSSTGAYSRLDLLGWLSAHRAYSTGAFGANSGIVAEAMPETSNHLRNKNSCFSRSGYQTVVPKAVVWEPEVTLSSYPSHRCSWISRTLEDGHWGHHARKLHVAEVLASGNTQETWKDGSLLPSKITHKCI